MLAVNNTTITAENETSDTFHISDSKKKNHSLRHIHGVQDVAFTDLTHTFQFVDISTEKASLTLKLKQQT